MEAFHELFFTVPALYIWSVAAGALVLWMLSSLCTKRQQGQGAPIATIKAEPLDRRRKYTKDEVAKHVDRGDCWIIVDDKVYDVTPYVEEHPGGDAILRNAGGDASEGFHGPQHPQRVYDIIDDFQIGELLPAK
ncbi:hypothetical protein KFL_000590040 [Klebsormidium nitens]|uniref:Cytochrome b5 heme-binding domain-containing protein n=1 Tax=Klebsormidium nitens TaxID=105231 RepID=A0A1Y1HS59_KLENI|nr:hypothetical protein KFL_000590040 [Klebsormidium nitens]|eukprot:GAQ80652.1 hypothetical protein KFL_000590040 [Klebsormidium nitens]